MTLFGIYIVKLSLGLALFYIAYKIFMSKMKTHSLNRSVMIGILIFSAILPLLRISLIPENNEIVTLNALRELFTPISPDSYGQTIPESQPSDGNFIVPIQNILFLLYFIGIFLLSLKFIISLLRVFQLLRKANFINSDGITIAISGEAVQPFTFLNQIIINADDYNKNSDIIIKHEKAHIKLHHAADILLLELLILVQWFNPFIWLFRRDLKLVHEFQADAAVIKNGINAQTYQLLVLEKAVGKRRFAMANQFIQKPIIKRLQMIQKTKTPRCAGLKLLLFVPLAALLLQAFSKPEAIAGIAPSTLLSVKDSTKKWLDLWTLENINRIEKEYNSNRLGIVDNSVDPSKQFVFKERNVMIILINRRNQFLVEGEKSTLTEAINGAEKFLAGKPVLQSQKYAPEFIEKEYNNLGEIKIYKSVISIQYDIGSDKKIINELLRGIGEKYLALRQEKSKAFFQKDYFDLTTEQKKIIDEVVPIKLSLAKPKKMGSPPPPPPPPPPTVKNN